MLSPRLPCGSEKHEINKSKKYTAFSRGPFKIEIDPAVLHLIVGWRELERERECVYV